MHFQLRDLTGQRFGELVALEHVGYDRFRRALWRCECSCGAMKTVRSNNLLQHHTISCRHVNDANCSALGRARKTKFDVAEAKRLRTLGWGYKRIGQVLGAWPGAVYRELTGKVWGRKTEVAA
jgi:hypothetical protein